MRHDGSIDQPLDEAAVREAAKALKKAGVKAIAVSFLYGFVLPSTRPARVEIIREEYPEAFVCSGHEIAPEFREFERLSTVVLTPISAGDEVLYRPPLPAPRGAGHGGDAAPHPVQRRRHRLLHRCRHAGAHHPLRPPTGVVAAQAVGELAGFPDIITFDMGGTSTDVALLKGGVCKLTSEPMSMAIR